MRAAISTLSPLEKQQNLPERTEHVDDAYEKKRFGQRQKEQQNRSHDSGYAKAGHGSDPASERREQCDVEYLRIHVRLFSFNVGLRYAENAVLIAVQQNSRRS